MLPEAAHGGEIGAGKWRPLDGSVAESPATALAGGQRDHNEVTGRAGGRDSYEPLADPRLRNEPFGAVPSVELAALRVIAVPT